MKGEKRLTKIMITDLSLTLFCNIALVYKNITSFFFFLQIGRTILGPKSTNPIFQICRTELWDLEISLGFSHGAIHKYISEDSFKVVLLQKRVLARIKRNENKLRSERKHLSNYKNTKLIAISTKHKTNIKNC